MSYRRCKRIRWPTVILHISHLNTQCQLTFQVRGYVKAASKVGVFVTLSHDVDARVRLSNLAETFVKDPEAAFPVGQLVSGRILKVTPERWLLYYLMLLINDFNSVTFITKFRLRTFHQVLTSSPGCIGKVRIWDLTCHPILLVTSLCTVFPLVKKNQV